MRQIVINQNLGIILVPFRIGNRKNAERIPLDAVSDNRVRKALIIRAVIDITEQDGLSAYKSDMKDFEDALIAHSAARNGVDAIITYNIKDYVNSPVKALLPADFVTMFKPDNVSYAEAELEH